MDHHTSKISAIEQRPLECVGPVFLELWEVKPKSNRFKLTDEDSEDVQLGDLDSGDISPTRIDPDANYLRNLDPKQWKDQDHYAVLGLSKLRHLATEEDIRKAYRSKVLHHHPDKCRVEEGNIQSDDSFTCITKAWEILGNGRNRRSYDSVDPYFDNSIPPASEHSRNNFYEVFGRVFETNSRWSEKQPVPQLGDESSTRERVEQFYSFWYNFESWREFSYLDEEEKDQGQGRDERKWIEKNNKIARAKRKKEEMSRIRNLVDNAYSLDPRILKFKQEEKDRKLALKQARKDAARARQEEEERKQQALVEEERKKKEEAEAKLKAEQEAMKAEREAQKRALKNKRSEIRRLARENEFYSTDSSEMVDHMASLEKIFECLRLEELENLATGLKEEGRTAFLRAVQDAEDHIERERKQLLESSTSRAVAGPSGRSKGCSAPWTNEELQLLIKAVKIFPAGTNQRWEVVANFINHHIQGQSTQRTSKEVLAKAKDLHTSDYFQLKVAANQKAYDAFEKDQKANVQVPSAPSSSQSCESCGVRRGENQTPWTASEQQLLEQALKTYPASTPERWDRIAECVPTRSKRDCMMRFKELAEMIRAKKAAKDAATSSNQDS
ncbi:dnaJ homolog subfamily C member 2 [Periplaneta americana]|uniref:dnaJ homolog subfamily C member 2 n=1 Tax=Periplaneta americana TaxID=6978 RepID=UPI0037E879BA